MGDQASLKSIGTAFYIITMHLHKSHQLDDLQAWWLHTTGSGMSAYHDSWQPKLLPMCCLFVMSKNSPTHTLAPL